MKKSLRCNPVRITPKQTGEPYRSFRRYEDGRRKRKGGTGFAVGERKAKSKTSGKRTGKIGCSANEGLLVQGTTRQRPTGKKGSGCTEDHLPKGSSQRKKTGITTNRLTTVHGF